MQYCQVAVAKADFQKTGCIKVALILKMMAVTGPKVAVVFGKYSREALQGPDNTEPIRIHLSMDQVAK